MWMGFLSDAKKPKPQKKDVHFLTYDEAFAYARGWLRGESVVEYGTILLEAIP